MVAFKKNISRLVVIGLLLAVLFFPNPARADVAPPAQPSGANLLPESDLTRVQMASEVVVIDVVQNPPSGSLGQAHVTADFIMHNDGDQLETMAVRFPLASDNGFGEYPELTNFEVNARGQDLEVRTVETEPESWDDPVLWAEFDINFPPGQDVSIQVSYTQEGTGEYPYISFGYILATGAGWNGPIGEGDIIVRLPYEANDYNVIFNQQIGWGQTTTGGILTGNEVQWHFENLEPTAEDNFTVVLVMPSAWQKVLNERNNTENHPNDGEAWGRLGKIYKEIIQLHHGQREDPGGLGLYQFSQDAYEQAITLLPDDALWHAGYADLLWVHYYYYESFSETPNLNELIHILTLLDHSLTLSPSNPIATSILTEIAYTVPEAVQMEGDNLIIVYLTATPIIESPATETPLPTATPPPTNTSTPTRTPLPTDTPTSAPTDTPLPTNTPPPTNVPPTPTTAPLPTPTPAPGIQICGVGLLPLLTFMTFWRKKKQKTAD